MFEVLSNEILAENLHKMVVSAPRVARARKPGQFVMVRLAQGEERIPSPSSSRPSALPPEGSSIPRPALL
jgi:NAD(P)H-flavin reductase